MMKCRFDSTGTIGAMCGAAVFIAIMAFSAAIAFYGSFDDRGLAPGVSLIAFIISVVAAVVLNIIKGGVIYARSDRLIIVHSFGAWKILVSRISYEDIEYADHNVTQKRSRLGFYCYVFELIIHMKSGKKIKLCVDLNIPEDKPMCDPDGYKRFINDQPIMKLCRYINEKSR